MTWSVGFWTLSRDDTAVCGCFLKYPHADVTPFLNSGNVENASYHYAVSFLEGSPHRLVVSLSGVQLWPKNQFIQAMLSYNPSLGSSSLLCTSSLLLCLPPLHWIFMSRWAAPLLSIAKVPILVQAIVTTSLGFCHSQLFKPHIRSPHKPDDSLPGVTWPLQTMKPLPGFKDFL